MTNIKALNCITYDDKEDIHWHVRGQAGICHNLTSRHKFKSSPKLFLVSVKGTGTIIKSPGICYGEIHCPLEITTLGLKVNQNWYRSFCCL